ncbi:MAG TPA: EAL domain-containing protein [Mycobacteriales bacterium]|nr:EAL domain-containing protein [Mycobacteriales bacterium]
MRSPVPLPATGPHATAPDGWAEYNALAERVLQHARTHLGMDVAWASELDSGQQLFSHVDAADPHAGPALGSTDLLDGSFCVRVLDGRLPNVITDARANPATRDLPVTAALNIGSYIGVPIRHGDGRVRGMLCCTSNAARPDLADRDVAVLEMLAGLLGALADQAGLAHGRGIATRERTVRAIDGVGRRVVLQPIVDVHTGVAVEAEALTRFDGPPGRPDEWFADAETVGLRTALELACAASALALLDRPDMPPAVSINLSPAAVLSDEAAELLAAADRRRVILEITEHAPVADYPALVRALEPHRAAGVRLAIDDVGAGYSSFRHILNLHPDIIKMDISLVRDIELDPVRQALAAALVTLARTSGAQLIAEGVETHAELDTLAGLGVTLAQGYLFSPPTAAPALDGYPTATSPLVSDR